MRTVRGGGRVTGTVCPWLVGLALVCAFVCAIVSAFVRSFRGLFACVLSWVEILDITVPYADVTELSVQGQVLHVEWYQVWQHSFSLACLARSLSLVRARPSGSNVCPQAELAK